MEPKKNPKYDLHRKRGVLLNVGLIVSLILVISAFKWKVPVRSNDYVTLEPVISEALVYHEIPATEFKKPDAIVKPMPVKPIVSNPTDFIETTEAAPENSETPPHLDQGLDPVDFATGSFEVPTETIEPDTFRVVEKMPEPIGGWSAFYKTLTKNIKYPKTATRTGAEGKVFVEFTINDKGQLSHFKVIKGIGHGCDEEATRVLALTKWNPGKQRGRPVNVRLVQPIVFDLGN